MTIIIHDAINGNKKIAYQLEESASSTVAISNTISIRSNNIAYITYIRHNSRAEILAFDITKTKSSMTVLFHREIKP